MYKLYESLFKQRSEGGRPSCEENEFRVASRCRKAKQFLASLVPLSPSFVLILIPSPDSLRGGGQYDCFYDKPERELRLTFLQWLRFETATVIGVRPKATELLGPAVGLFR
jgi:hypothetical protein